MSDSALSEMQECPCGEPSHASPAALDMLRAWLMTDNFEKYAKELSYAGIFGDHWSVNYHGMYVGIERDGRIHS